MVVPKDGFILNLEKKMTVKPLSVGIALVQVANGSPMMDYSLYSDSQNNPDPFIEVFNWRVNFSKFFDSYQKNGNINLLNKDITTNTYNSTTISYSEDQNDESLSIVWYLIAFAALVMFFLLISFSEVCCKKSFSKPPDNEIEVPPPPYDLFAPPTYESLYEKKTTTKNKIRKQLEVFVIPVFGDKISFAIPAGEPQRNASGSRQVVTSQLPT